MITKICSLGKVLSCKRALFFFLVTIWMVLGGVSYSRALELEFGPSVEARSEYNDNIRLTTAAAHDPVWMYTIIPRLRINGVGESRELRGDFRYEPRRYSGGGDLDSDNFFTNLKGVVKTEFDEWLLGVDYSRDSTIQSEFLDTGISDVSKVRKQKGVNPSWKRVLSDFSTLEVGYNYTGVVYQDGIALGLYDYEINTFSMTVSHLLGEFDYLILNLYYTAYDAPFVKSMYGDKGFMLSFSHVYSDYYRFDLSGGVRRTKFDNLLSENESSSGFIGKVNVTRKREVSSVQVSMERRIDPSGSGTLMQRDSLELRVTSRFSSTVNGALSLGVFRNISLERNFTRFDRTYYFVTPYMAWRLAREWSARLYYRYRYNKYDVASNEAQANVAGIIVQYQWPSPAARN